MSPALPAALGIFTKPGSVLYEMEGVTIEVAKEAFRLAAHKLPIATKFLAREISDEN